MLASQSPRRKQLLALAGVEFSVAGALVDDTDLCGGAVHPRHWATALAYLKAAGTQRKLREAGEDLRGTIVLGADTVVVKGNELFGKPRDERDAERIIGALENAEHEVITGVCLIESDTGARRLFADGATVSVGVVGTEATRRYLTTGRWAGKAGAYNLEEQVQAGWPITWSGDPTTVMGLPMKRLMPELRKLGLVGSART